MKRGENSNRVILSNASMGTKHSKGKFDVPKPSLARPQLKPHVCLNESNCKTCSEFINELNQWRKKK